MRLGAVVGGRRARRLHCHHIEPSASDSKARWDAENVFRNGTRQDSLAFLCTLSQRSVARSRAGVSQPQLTYLGPGRSLRGVRPLRLCTIDGKYLGSKDVLRDLVGGKVDRFFDMLVESNEAARRGCVRAVSGTRASHASARARAQSAALQELGGAIRQTSQ